MNTLPANLSHAYLITGGSEARRRAYALRLAQAYLCQEEEPPCGRCLACRKVEGGLHPDVSQVGPLEGKREIGVDQIRALRADAYVRPNEGRRKVYLIAPAEAMNPSAQNALLKVLEEGPEYVAFLLMAGQPGRLLDTVRSRCEHLILPPEEGQDDPAWQDRGEVLARLLLEGDELAVAQGLAALEQERLKSDQLTQLLAQAERQVAGALAHRPRRAAAVVRALKTCRECAPYHPGPGHVLGWLAGSLFDSGSPDGQPGSKE